MHGGPCSESIACEYCRAPAAWINSSAGHCVRPRPLPLINTTSGAVQSDCQSAEVVLVPHDPQLLQAEVIPSPHYGGRDLFKLFVYF